jgi:hypothetical protein
MSPRELVEETTGLCVKLFNAMGATSITKNDIDIAHRVPSKNPSRNPKPIICKFIRRLARDEVMSLRREARKVKPIDLGLQEQTNLTNALVLDHLTPTVQQLLADTKKFKECYNHSFCWTRNGTIVLRKTDSSTPIRIHNRYDLQTVNAQEEQR